MPEVFAWPEGQVYLYTGAAGGASAVVAYAQNTQGTLARGWDSHQTVDGVYADHLTGMRADLTVQAIYTPDATLLRMFQSATAIHLKLNHSGINGSAGIEFYSGRIDSLTLVGSDANPYVFSLTYHANIWSGYGL